MPKPTLSRSDELLLLLSETPIPMLMSLLWQALFFYLFFNVLLLIMDGFLLQQHF
jgi:hypothetical protein